MPVNRSDYFDYIEEKLSILAYRINSRGRLNLLNLNNFSEDFYSYFLNELYGWNSKNANDIKSNVEAIDLIDHDNKVVIQVSSTNRKEKIESSLNKELIELHATYTFKFVSIANDADDLRSKTFKNPHCISFDPLKDIIDRHSILNFIKSLEITKKRKIFDFIRKELGEDVDAAKFDSNLAAIINLLAEENWSETGGINNYNPFEIDRKIVHNDLRSTKKIIDEYKIFYKKVDEKYTVFDASGSNKSYSVLQLIGKFYVEESINQTDSDTIFVNVCRRVMEQVQESGNFISVEYEVLSLCVDILVVDAFIRCKIFENPENYSYVAT